MKKIYEEPSLVALTVEAVDAISVSFGEPALPGSALEPDLVD